MHPAHIDDPDHTFRGMPFAEILRPVMGPEDLLEHRLGQLGLGLGDVTHVFNTHLHFDHCGQNFLFTDVPILVHKAHYEAALTGPAFPNENFDLPDLHYELFEGDFGRAVPRGDHVDHARPRAAPPVAADRAAQQRSDPAGGRRDLHPSQPRAGAWGSQADPVAAKAGGEMLAAVARDRGALLVFGHDPQQWTELRRAPEGFYD